VEELEQERLATITLTPDASSIGHPLSQFALKAIGVRDASFRRSSGQVVSLDAHPVLEDGDALVLSGMPESLALAEELLLRG
ncbi:MAG: potassium transporter, partial [Ramlibacter sp.]|nr:potassium transporter [Ramlibacter sp.]